MPPNDTLSAWSGHWLTVHCACARRVHLPLKLLARDHGAETPLPRIVARLRCAKCGARPSAAELVESPQTSAPGYARGYPSGRA
ncbi:hypothetical protein KTR66_04760 [Roseococcus sp. SDR]|uniref:hypothetical protein n=1 Tax=Roseococcus sp. SDR TaxID=2835532 RepID=UPI001BCC2B24|nr:hypothetical protein [Roseococcus sp. SDR]MBS7789291.1 hypothetical protein [Roseococcus sp. SDR]MBV1844605.1 hypothetical protein [Roseococcus sp. SDR]